MSEKSSKVLIFGLGNEMYATNITEVERILEYGEPTELPDSPNFVLGVINYEESVIPIVSLSIKFKLRETKEKEQRKIIVVKREEKKFGIIVDNVYEVRDVNQNIIESPPEITNSIDRNYISGLIKLEKNIVIMIDLENVLSDKDENQIF